MWQLVVARLIDNLYITIVTCFKFTSYRVLVKTMEEVNDISIMSGCVSVHVCVFLNYVDPLW